MRRTIQIALAALFLIIFANSILSAPVPTFYTLSSVSTLLHPSHGGRQAVGIHAHHTSCEHKEASSVFAYSYPHVRLHTAKHEEPYHETDSEVKKPSYEIRPSVGINAHHTSSQYKSQELVLAYSYASGRLYDPKTGKLGRLEAAILTIEDVKACHDEIHSHSQPPNPECYGAEAHLFTTSCSHHLFSLHLSNHHAIPDRDEKLPSSWVLKHWKITCGYINHSNLFTEDVFEWALWLLGLALLMSIGVELLNMWNARLQKVIEGAGVETELEDAGTEYQCQTINNAIREKERDAIKDETLKTEWDWYEKISLLTRQYTHSQSKMGEGQCQDIDDDTDENGMEKSSW